MPDLEFIRGQIEHMRVQVGRQRKEILTLQRAGIPAASAEACWSGCSTKSTGCVSSATSSRRKCRSPSHRFLEGGTGSWTVLRSRRRSSSTTTAFSVVDATGRFILAVTHRQDLHKSRYTYAGNYLNEKEAETIANAVVKLR